MSLINDALRRAKQQTAQPAGNLNLPLRPAEAPPHSNSGTGMLLMLGFVAVLVAAGAVVPMVINKRTPSETLITASVPKKAVEPIQAAAIVPEPVAEPLAAASTPAPEVVPPVVEPVEPKAPPLKLNGIFFHSAKPSAIINGKTVYTNSAVGEYRVQEIQPGSVRLVSATGTNVLSFAE